MIPPLFSDLPDVFRASFDPDAPWTLLGEPLDEILPSDIVVSDGARVHPTAVIEGRVFIGRHAEVRPGAYIRGGVWIGEHGVVSSARSSATAS